jgi:hypothetical protein
LTYTGNHLKKLLANIDVVVSDLPKENPEISERVEALKLLSRIQDFGKPQFLTQTEIADLKSLIQELKQKMTSSEVLKKSSATPKWHLLLKRFTQYLDKYNSYAYFNEQPIEAIHSRLKQLRKKFCVYDEKLIQERLMKYQWFENTLNDLQEDYEDYTVDVAQSDTHTVPVEEEPSTSGTIRSINVFIKI